MTTTVEVSGTGDVPASSQIVVKVKEPNFYFSVDDREFKGSDLFESIILIETDATGEQTETDITDQVTFNGATPVTEFAKNDGSGDYAGIYKGYVSPYYNGEVIADAQSLVYIGVKGDATLDGAVNIDDASTVLKYYANSAAGLPAALLTDPVDVNYETLAFFLADVDTESKAGVNSDTGKLELADATFILAYYAQSAAGLAPEWDVIIPALKDLTGSLWYDRAQAQTTA